MVISFRDTHQYLPPNGTKDTTRRKWSDRTFKNWCNAWDKGILCHAATDRGMRNGGQYIGVIWLKERPFQQSLLDMPKSDLVREGGMRDSVEGFIQRYFDGDADQTVTVIRFDFMPIESLDGLTVPEYVKSQKSILGQQQSLFV